MVGRSDTSTTSIIDGITIKRYKCLARPLRNPLTPGMLLLGNEIKKFDIVHTHNEHSFAAMVAAYLRRRADVPLILTCHGQLIFGSKMADYFERVYSRTVGKKIFNIMDVIVVNSIMDREYILSINSNLSEKINVLHNAIDPDFFETVTNNASYRDNEGKIKDMVSSNSKTILFVGRLIKRKGVEWLIKAMNIIVNELKRNDVLCTLVGDGEDYSYFDVLVNELNLGDHVLFTRSVSNEDLICMYRSADIFALPSLSEVCPTVVLEAMYFGLPVVATDIPGVKDHFKDVALLVPPKNENRLAEAIVKLLEDEELTRRLSKAGGKLVKSKYTWDVVASEYEKIYEELKLLRAEAK
jgi:glycosyltransferase involved in cell wall biosynthesis